MSCTRSRASIRPPAALVHSGPASATMPKAARGPCRPRPTTQAKAPTPGVAAAGHAATAPVSAREERDVGRGVAADQLGRHLAAVGQRHREPLLLGQAFLGGDDPAVGPDRPRSAGGGRR